jgi:hypothetical protein
MQQKCSGSKQPLLQVIIAIVLKQVNDSGILTFDQDYYQLSAAFSFFTT